jgi:hypothetical protein
LESPVATLSRRAGIPRWAFMPLVVALVLGLWLAADGRISGDEPSYLYAAEYLSIPQLIAGDVQPSGIPGFLQGRILHILFVKGVMAVAGAGEAGFRVLQLIHLGLVALNLLIIGRILRSLLPQVAEARAVAIALAMTPIALYFAFKTTADNEALFAALVATLGLLRIAEGGGAGWMAAVILGLAAAALTKNQMALVPASFWIAACLVPVAGVDRRRLALLGAGCGIAGVLLTIALLETSGIGTRTYVESYSAPFEGVTPAMVKLMNVGTELGLAWLLLPLALFSKHRRELLALSIWFGASLAPFLLVPGVEPRHVAVNLAPAGGLIALAFEALRERWTAPAGWVGWRKGLVATLCVVALMSANAVFLAIMPHKVDLDRMRSLLAALDERFGPDGHTLLAASAYTDFHIIRVLWPDRDVLHVEIPVLAIDTTRRTRDELLHGYFGDRYREHLSGIANAGKPLVFFGYRATLAVWNLRAMLDKLSPALADRVLGRVTPVEHLFSARTEWIWNSPEVRLEPVARSGPYEAFEVLIR